MEIKSLKKLLLSIFSIAYLVACSGGGEVPPVEKKAATTFKADILTIKEYGNAKRVRGQVLYVPIYSNIPCRGTKLLYDLSAFIAVHNTDLHGSIRVTKVLFFDNDGKLVNDFLKSESTLGPMGAMNFHIPRQDKSGTGANFLVEWRSENPVSEPLVESVMLDCETHKGMSFVSRGKVIREVP